MDAAALISTISDWIAAHPGWAGWLVFAIALGESLAVAGLFVPGAVLMFVVGALVGGGMMELWPTLLWATAGAVAGDAISYGLGRYYHEQLGQIWPFRRYPALIDRGKLFFQRHGGKGVLFGRFVGPVRPIVPLVAGMMDMPAWHFFMINIVSAMLWAPAYILPGVVFSSSLGMATEVAGRLAVVLLLLFTVVLATIWLVRWFSRLLQPRANPLIARVLVWSRHHRLVGEIAEALLDPEHPEARGLAILSVVLATAVIVSVLLFAAIQESRLLGNLDLLIFNSLQQLRTPWADRLMVFVTWFGDVYGIGTVLAAAIGWLAWSRNRLAIYHLLAVAFCTEAMVLLLKVVTAVERPMVIYQGVNAFSFPSGHAAMSTAVFGMLAIIISGALPVARRWLVYGVAGTLAALIGFSRLYLGAHWLSDVLGGMMLGVVWAALLGIAYRRHLDSGLRALPERRRVAAAGRLGMVVILALSINGVWAEARLEHEMQRYVSARSTQQLEMKRWWNGAWNTLPAYRGDLRSLRNQPLTLQWAGTIDEVRAALTGAGWQVPPPFDLAHLLHMLAPDMEMGKLPVLPQVNDGRHEVLRMVRPTSGAQRLLVLRLWPTDILLLPNTLPLWQGEVSYLHFSRVAGLVTVGRTESDFIRPLDDFLEDVERLPGLLFRQVSRQIHPPPTVQWDGRLILLRMGEYPVSPAAGTSDPDAAADR